MINLRKLAEQQKYQNALKIKNRILKQTHNFKTAENFPSITKKLDTINESTKKIGEDIKESNSENEIIQEMAPVKTESEEENIHTNLRTLPNKSIFSELMTKALGSLMSSSNSLKIKSSLSGATFLGVPVNTLGGDNNTYDITPEIHKALSSTYYTGKTMKNENYVFMTNNNMRDLGYIGRGVRQPDRKLFFPKTF